MNKVDTAVAGLRRVADRASDPERPLAGLVLAPPTLRAFARMLEQLYDAPTLSLRERTMIEHFVTLLPVGQDHASQSSSR